MLYEEFLFLAKVMMNKPDFDDIFMELAVNLAKRSHCIKKHVGAVLTKDTRIISIGYNGPPAGTHRADRCGSRRLLHGRQAGISDGHTHQGCLLGSEPMPDYENVITD